MKIAHIATSTAAVLAVGLSGYKVLHHNPAPKPVAKHVVAAPAPKPAPAPAPAPAPVKAVTHVSAPVPAPTKTTTTNTK